MTVWIWNFVIHSFWWVSALMKMVNGTIGLVWGDKSMGYMNCGIILQINFSNKAQQNFLCKFLWRILETTTAKPKEFATYFSKLYLWSFVRWWWWWILFEMMMIMITLRKAEWCNTLNVSEIHTVWVNQNGYC
jgi:hypothetical protein